MITATLQQFQEDVLGVNAPKPHAMVRLPAKLFKDMSARGSLHAILRQCFEYKKTMDWRRLDFQTPAKRDANLQLLMSVERVLLDRGLLKRPRIAFHRSVPASARPALKALFALVHAEEAASASTASHVLFPSPPAEDDDEDWFRPLEKRDRRAFVHWWYYPDSYDSWIPDSEAVAEPEPAPLHKGPWLLTARWLEDSAKYNELMNEEDYELPEDDDAPAASAALICSRAICGLVMNVTSAGTCALARRASSSAHSCGK